MVNRWGNDDHGPGGDPSWLGGGDSSGADSQGSDGWSSGFGSDDQRSDSDFGGSDSDFGGRRDPQAAEQMAPRFGGGDGDGPLPSGRDEDAPWTSSFTGQEDGASGPNDWGVTRVIGKLGKIVPIIITVIVALVFFRVFFGGHGFFGGFSSWWVLLFFGIPLIKKAVRVFRRGRDD